MKIADFGLAAKLLGNAPDTALTMSQATMGTLNYMAPEQRQNAQGVDHRADIYSLGVVFYEMLTGEVPMGRFEPPSKRVQVDVRLDEVVLKALEREPARRYQHASEVKSNVETINSTPPAAPPVPPAPRAAAQGVPTRFPVSDFFFLVLLLLALWASGVLAGLIPLLGLPLFLVILLLGIRQLSGRVQIYQAREKGLWPQLGEIATLEHVKRLEQAGEKKLAIKLYRQMHGDSGADAKAAMAKLAGSSTSPQKAEASPAPAPPSASVSLQPRLSRTALVGAAWAFGFLLFALGSFIIAAYSQFPDGKRPQTAAQMVMLLNIRWDTAMSPSTPWLEKVLEITIMLVGLTAPFGATILGYQALSQIRFSAGRVYGLGLALFDLLFFPLVAVDYLAMGVGLS